MKVGFLSYPMLFQTQGGLQIQILESIAALKQRGIDARLCDPNVEHLSSFDVVHVFSAINGNQRIVEHAKAFGVPVVCSPLIRPHWTRSLGSRGRLIDRLVGRLTNWEIKSEYRQIESCLQNSNLLIALGEVERKSITDAFQIPQDRILVVPNGIPKRFFSATHDLAHAFLENKTPFLLCVATIDIHKNQLGLARATEKSGLQLVLAGECLPGNREYLAQLTAFPHVKYLGKMDYQDPLLASLYAAATVFCLTSHSEVMPLCVLEALAAGTPVVMTKHHCMDLSGTGDLVLEVDPADENAIAAAANELVTRIPDQLRCREAVKRYTWDAVAAQLEHAYTRVLNTSLLLHADADQNVS
ncbi:MAG: glycosyltransferase family 4 protein [Azoarcus sp. PHD]|nr:MAG: glycosyltransferase family 4 protein [Azoarcus sp. PHD]